MVRGNSYFDILDRMAFLLSLPGNDCMDHPGNTSLASDSLADQEVLHRPSHKGLGRSSTLSNANCTSLHGDSSDKFLSGHVLDSFKHLGTLTLNPIRTG